MKIILSTVVAAGLLAAGASAASADVCGDQARHAANARAVGTTVVGTGVGLLIGKAIGGKKGLAPGGIAGGVTGYAIGSAQWNAVYNKAYKDCIAASTPVRVAPRVVTVTPLAPVSVVAGPPPSGQAAVYINLNVRYGPGIEYDAFATIPPNSSVQVTGCVPKWCSVLLGPGGGSGWAFREYLNFF